ncbi:MAG: hypothetical protein HY292_27735 [Planctomycetes bacterium]|nr:hypothetical protein [Planctomycetota bacterium]
MRARKQTALALANWCVAALALLVSLIPNLHPCCCGPLGVFCSRSGSVASVSVREAPCCSTASDSRSSGPVVRSETRHCCAPATIGDRSREFSVVAPPKPLPTATVVLAFAVPSPIVIPIEPPAARGSHAANDRPGASSLPILLCALRI